MCGCVCLLVCVCLTVCLCVSCCMCLCVLVRLSATLRCLMYCCASLGPRLALLWIALPTCCFVPAPLRCLVKACPLLTHSLSSPLSYTLSLCCLSLGHSTGKARQGNLDLLLQAENMPKILIIFRPATLFKGGCRKAS